MPFSDEYIEKFLVKTIFLRESSFTIATNILTAERFCEIYKGVKEFVIDERFLQNESIAEKQFIKTKLKDDPFYFCDMYARAFAKANRINDFYEVFKKCGKKYVPEDDIPWWQSKQNYFPISSNKFCYSLSTYLDFFESVNKAIKALPKNALTVENIKIILEDTDYRGLSPRLLAGFHCSALNGYNNTIQTFAESIKEMIDQEGAND